MKQKLIEPRITEYLHRKASITKTPISGTFELLPLCNMDCKMCYIKMSKEKQESIARLRTNEEWIELAKKARERGSFELFRNLSKIPCPEYRGLSLRKRQCPEEPSQNPCSGV